MKSFLLSCLYDYSHPRFRWVQWVIGLVVLLSLSTTLLQWYMEGQGVGGLLWRGAEWCIVGVFTLEYVLRWYAAPKRWAYLFSGHGLVDLLSVLPFYLGLFSLITRGWVLVLRVFRMGKFLFTDEIHYAHLEEIERVGRFGLITFHPEEHLHYIARRSPFFFVMEMLVLTALGGGVLLGMGFFEWQLYALGGGGILLLLLFVFFWRAWSNHRYDTIYVTNRRIIMEDKELFGAVINEVPLELITNVVPDTRGLLNTVLQMGTLCVETGGAEDRMGFSHVHRPYVVADMINRERMALAGR